MSRFIELYDDTGYKYIVDIDKITSVCVEGKRIWFDRKTTLDICDKSMDHLCRRLVRERSLTKSNVMTVTCPACGMSNSIAWGSTDLPPFRQAVAMLADSWNSR